MSKILKVVDGKHYIIPKGWVYELKYGQPYGALKVLFDAGNRELICPVEQWSDARKADKLCEWGYDGFDYYSEVGGGMTACVKDESGDKPKFIEGHGKDLTEALTNLVIAVAEEE